MRTSADPQKLCRQIHKTALGRSTTRGLVETFVLGDLSRQLSWSETPAQLHHYRDRDGYAGCASSEPEYAARPG
jgi:hypothetical protein